MIELKSNSLRFTFPEVHPEAEPSIDFRRTLRIPDDNSYPLPENEPVKPEKVKVLKDSRTVREGRF